MLIPLDDIIVGERIRDEFGSPDEWKEFVESIRIHGQIQAVSVEKDLDSGKYRLIGGERRIRAIRQLNEEGVAIPELPAGHVLATLRDPMGMRKRMLMEFAENNSRKDFTYIEKARYIRRFHETMVEETDGAWTQELTAATLSLSRGSISQYLRLEEAVKENEIVGKASTLRAAVKRMKTQEKLDARHAAVKTENTTAYDRANKILAHGDAREWIKSIPSDSVDLVNFDPPWGDETSRKSAGNHEAFEDSEDYSNALMSELFPEIYRILKPDRFCIFWFRSWASESMRMFALKFGFNTTHTRTPCLWYKSDKTSDQNRVPEKQLIEAYEPFYLLRKGDPVFHERMAHNVFTFDRVLLGDLIHPTEKPVDLCSSLIRLTTVPGEVVLDPTAGSSAFLDAALRASRKAQGCELSDTYYQRGITRLAEYLKTFKES